MSALARWIDGLNSGARLGRAGSRTVLELLVSGEAPTGEIKALLAALNAAGFGEEELTGFAEGLRAKAVALRPEREPLLDNCGTGGDGLKTINISTAAAFVVAGCGVAVAKHGNRSVSSRSGSADVLEALGVAIDDGPEAAKASIEQEGFGFLYAPLYHPAMRHVAAARRELGVRSIFNLLGPLVNPAGVSRQVVGIYAPDLLESYARVLLGLGSRSVLVVCGEDGMDELSLCAPTNLCRGSAGGALHRERVTPESAGLKRCAPADLAGGDAAHNAAALESALGGRPGPRLDAILFNASAALLVAGQAGDLREGVEAARLCVRSGAAAKVLERLRARKREAAA